MNLHVKWSQKKESKVWSHNKAISNTYFLLQLRWLNYLFLWPVRRLFFVIPCQYCKTKCIWLHNNSYFNGLDEHQAEFQLCRTHFNLFKIAILRKWKSQQQWTLADFFLNMAPVFRQLVYYELTRIILAVQTQNDHLLDFLKLTHCWCCTSCPSFKTHSLHSELPSSPCDSLSSSCVLVCVLQLAGQMRVCVCASGGRKSSIEGCVQHLIQVSSSYKVKVSTDIGW